MTRYRNSWFRKNDDRYGPEFYQTDVRPQLYRGFLIYERIDSRVWDVVNDQDVCVGQYAGPRGARDFIDRTLANQQEA